MFPGGDFWIASLILTLSTITLVTTLPTLDAERVAEWDAEAEASHPLGINCRGSINCIAGEHPTDWLSDTVLSIADADLFFDTTHIACVSNHNLRLDGHGWHVPDPVPEPTANATAKHAATARSAEDVNFGFCLFLQHLPSGPKDSGVNGSEIKRLLTELHNHGCKGCGSVPLGFGWNAYGKAIGNDPSTGLLTMNWVNHMNCGDGICMGW